MTKRLSELLADCAPRAVHGSREVPVAALTYDSRTVTAGCCFFAVEGGRCDGHDFIPAAVAGGASTVVCRRLPAERSDAVTYVEVDDVQAALADMAAAF